MPFENSDSVPDTVFRPNSLAQGGGAATHSGIGGGDTKRTRQRAGFETAAQDRSRTHTQLKDPAAPVELIEKERNHDGRHTGAQAGRGGAGSAVVDGRGYARQQPVKRRPIDRENVFGQFLGRETSPPSQHNGALPGHGQRLHDRARQTGGFAIGHASEAANVYRRRTILEEGG